MKALLGKIARRFVAKAADRPPAIVVEGARTATGGTARNRVVMTMAVFFGIYGVIAGRLPDLDVEQTYHKLKSGTGFVWLRRQLSPKQQNDIMNLGIPGIGFRTEKRRFYPGGETAAHILGLTNIDNQ